MNTTSPPLTKLSTPKQALGTFQDDGSAILGQRVYLNGFPKSGLHLIELWVRILCRPATAKGSAPWFGSFDNHAWSLKWDRKRLRQLPKLLETWPAGTYVKGHMGHRRSIASAFWDNVIATVFVYRDLRDVAISAAYHVHNTDLDIDGEDKLKHPNKAMFSNMTIEETIVTIIKGRGIHAGLIDRWKLYRPWLSEKWVLHLRFEDMRQKAEDTASLLIRYVLGYTVQALGLKISIPGSEHDAAVASMMELSGMNMSSTYRKGAVGDWREHWTAAIDAAWEQAQGPRYNAELGYG